MFFKATRQAHLPAAGQKQPWRIPWKYLLIAVALAAALAIGFAAATMLRGGSDSSSIGSQAIQQNDEHASALGDNEESVQIPRFPLQAETSKNQQLRLRNTEITQDAVTPQGQLPTTPPLSATYIKPIIDPMLDVGLIDSPDITNPHVFRSLDVEEQVCRQSLECVTHYNAYSILFSFLDAALSGNLKKANLFVSDPRITEKFVAFLDKEAPRNSLGIDARDYPTRRFVMRDAITAHNVVPGEDYEVPLGIQFGNNLNLLVVNINATENFQNGMWTIADLEVERLR